VVQAAKKLTLRNFDDFKTQVNCLQFSPCGRYVAACANETTWRMFDIQKGDGALLV
jgi:WD40 repeat protein